VPSGQTDSQSFAARGDHPLAHSGRNWDEITAGSITNDPGARSESWAVEFFFGCWASPSPSYCCWPCARIDNGTAGRINAFVGSYDCARLGP
jgi:hypothetical protein